MTIKERMTARTEREKDLLKFGRGQGRKQEQERIIKLLWANVKTMTHPYDNEVIQSLRISPKAFENLIKGEN